MDVSLSIIESVSSSSELCSYGPFNSMTPCLLASFNVYGFGWDTSFEENGFASESEDTMLYLLIIIDSWFEENMSTSFGTNCIDS